MKIVPFLFEFLKDCSIFMCNKNNDYDINKNSGSRSFNIFVYWKFDWNYWNSRY